MKYTDINITLCGLGIWGAKIAEKLRSFGTSVDGIDNDPRARESVKDLGLRSCGEELRIPEDAHGIIIATPSTTHYSPLQELTPFRLPIFDPFYEPHYTGPAKSQ